MVIGVNREFLLANADQPDSFWLPTAQQLRGVHPSTLKSSSHPIDSSGNLSHSDAANEAETAVLPLPNAPLRRDDNVNGAGNSQGVGPGGSMVRRFRKAGHAVMTARRFQSSVGASTTAAANTLTEAFTSAGAQDETTASLPSTYPTLDGTAVDRSSGALEEEEERAKGAWAALLRAEPLNQAFDQELASVESYKEAEASADPTALALDLSAGDLMDVDLDQ
jgi:hypothetical protein